MQKLKTSHPLIYRAGEKSIIPDILWRKLDQLEIAIGEQDIAKSMKLLSDLILNGNVKTIIDFIFFSKQPIIYLENILLINSIVHN